MHVNHDIAVLERDNQYLRLLVRAGELLGQSLDYHETLREVCDAAVATVADVCIIDLGTERTPTLVAAAHRDPERTAEVQAAGSHLESAPGRPQHPALQVIDTHRPLLVEQIDDAWIDEHATSDEHASYMRKFRYQSLIIVPVVSLLWGVRGALTLATTAGGSPPLVGQNALLVALDLGRRCGSAIGKALEHRQVLAVAERFQRAAMPRVLPNFDRFRFDALYEPAAESLLVGGDWYDVFPLPDGKVGISVGDVSGHGLEAAVLMASIKNALQCALVVEPDLIGALDAADFLLRNERHVQERFCTAMLAILDPEEMVLKCAVAGHPRPKIWRPSTAEISEPVMTRDLPLGCRYLAPGSEECVLKLEPGALLVFYTDGLVENQFDFLKGERQLEDAIRRPEIRESDDVARAIGNAMLPSATNDDVAILVVHTL